MKVFVAVFLCILIVRNVRAQYKECRNPNQRTGQCVDISWCPALMKSRSTNSGVHFILASFCGYDRNNQALFCCTWDSDYDGEASNVLPLQDTCGGDIVNLNILSGKKTVISEFSWMALLYYRPLNGGNLVHKCAGSLINHRYVLTAAHCVTGRYILGIGRLVSVKLGVHDTRTAKDSISMAIEEIHVHENYTDGYNFLNDIALIRLESKVDYSATIRPICLPSTVGNMGMSMRDGQLLYVSGWGRTLNGQSSPTKLKVEVGYWNNIRCKARYFEQHIALKDSQICAGGQKHADSCEGDSGGPLMSYHQGVWVLQGIVSFGYNCGLANWPGVYTKVASYDYWIKEKMRP